jgi:hypothetical protein
MKSVHPYIAFTGLLLTACVADDPGASPDDETTVFGPPNYPGPVRGMETQGRHIFGARLDEIDGEPGWHVSVTTSATDAAGAPATIELVGLASLRGHDANGVVHEATDTWFSGLRLPVVGGGELAVSVASATTYRLLLHAAGAPPAAGWRDPCDGGEAIPLAGRFSRRGTHEANVDRISFACADGVAFKCTLWGYGAGDDPLSTEWSAHQACTRMARADYCGDGTSHTREETYISIYDSVGVNDQPPAVFPGVSSWPPAPGGYHFEAAWRDGEQSALCLTRLRWQSLPLGGDCEGGELPDPRVDTSVQFCDEYAGSDELTADGALLFDSSLYNDLALHVWQKGADQIATVRGFDAGASLTVSTQPPVPGYTHVAVDGLLLRSLPGSISGSDVATVRMYEHPTTLDSVVARIAPTGYLPVGAQQGWEGMVLRQEHEGTVMLTLYRGPTGDLLSTTLTPPAGYTYVDDVGYVFQPE